MKVIAIVFAVLCLSLVQAEESDVLTPFEEVAQHDFGHEFSSLLELGNQLKDSIGPSDALVTYLPSSGPYDNPATDTTPTPTIPSTPSCTIRGQTIFEIRKMRADAKQIGMSIMYEIQTMEKRKAYIEQMTSYLNDRIRELNKVKRDLAAEQKWIAVSNKRIAELAQREKLIKLQDVMACIRGEQERLQGEKTTKVTALTGMTAEANRLQTSIKAIRQSMTAITARAGAQASGLPANAAGAAPGAAPGAPPGP